MSFFTELRRRNVIRVAAAYLIIGWLLVQILELAADSFEAPAWVMKIIITVVIIGFIPTVLFSWAFELTPDGLKRDSDVDRSSASGAQTSNKLNVITIVAAVGVMALFGWQQLNPRSGAAVGEPSAGPDAAVTAAARSTSMADETQGQVEDASIAVLPFADLSPEGDQGYFSDGVSEEILNVLAGIDGLRVASRTSAFAYKNSQQRIPVIAQELRVRHILEGSVRRAGDTIRVTAQLIDAKTDEHLLSETFDRQLTAENVFAIQGDIAQLIVTALAKRIEIEGDATTLAVTADTANIATLDLYYEANALFLLRGRENLARSMTLFEQITTRDPGFARGWAGLSAVYGVARGWGLQERSYFELARAAANRAIELNPKLSTPYAVLASVEHQSENPDWSSIAENFDRALQLDPDDPNLYNWRALFWEDTGFAERAFADYETCLQLDPSYLNCGFNKHALLITLGREEEADKLNRSLLLKGATIHVHSGAQIKLLADRRDDDGLLMALNQVVAESYPDQRWMVKELYLALTDPDFDHAKRLKAFELRRDKTIAATGVDRSRASHRTMILIAFRDFSRAIFDSALGISAAEFSFYPGISPALKRQAAIDKGLVRFWHEQGFPPQCRAVGKDDFACDW